MQDFFLFFLEGNRSFFQARTKGFQRFTERHMEHMPGRFFLEQYLVVSLHNLSVSCI